MFSQTRSHKLEKMGQCSAKIRRRKLKPFNVILGMPGTGKTKRAKELIQGEQAIFMAITAAVVNDAPESANVAMTVAAFLCSNFVPPPNHTIYIDEISMISRQTMQKILKRLRNNKLIMTGDQYQIAPITNSDTNDFWFTSEEYTKREKTTHILNVQHRLTGPECKTVRTLLEEIVANAPQWKNTLITLIAENRTKTPPANAKKLVFTNKDNTAIAKQWAQKNNLTLNMHGLCENMPVRITANKKHPTIPFKYTYRNGQTGTLVKFGEGYTQVKDDESGKMLKVDNRGHAKTIPQLKSALAETVDSAQGKTIEKEVNVIINAYLPDPPHIIVAATRSKNTSFTVKSMAMLEAHIRSNAFEFDAQVIEFSKTL
ncbi:MAG: hypothetical protein CMO80_14075 [Verrucomicrobiales bacterium]|nr:hypothetical protein [Verrucomicrobiales bacterium]